MLAQTTVHCIIVYQACQTLSCWTFLGHLEMLTIVNWDGWLCYPHNCSDLFGGPSSHSKSWILTSMCLFAVQRMAKQSVYELDTCNWCKRRAWMTVRIQNWVAPRKMLQHMELHNVRSPHVGCSGRLSDWQDVAFCRSQRRSWVGSVNRRHEFQYRHV